ncbi:helicase associated domain-containing protein [Streptomyces sp. WM6378]|uniref:helicase associated domain-containing protein n=1 Tax=Streptomyces sp. WM6378 TaxID=1415557 RepID=UPI00131EA4CE|nr:helicase associated domain-containing protein [Streptomyces sp. WM6378]
MRSADLPRRPDAAAGRVLPHRIRQVSHYPLGRWLSDQRRALQAGQMNSKRADELQALGVAWDTADAQSAENLAAARLLREDRHAGRAPTCHRARQAGRAVVHQHPPSQIGNRAPLTEREVRLDQAPLTGRQMTT